MVFPIGDKVRYSIDQIEAFVVAAKNSSFSKAAKILGKAQSTISQAIGNLEIDLGVQLFDRATKYPQLTAEGRTLLSEAESVLFHCRTFEESSMNLLKEVEAAISLAFDETVPLDLLSSALAVLTREYPHVGVRTVAAGPEGVPAQIQAGEADLGFTVVHYKYPQDIGFYRLGQMLLVNVVHRDHPLAGVGDVRFSHLNATRQLVYAPNAKKVPTNQHMDSRSLWSFYSYAAILELVRKKMGWAAVPKYMADPYIKSGELVKLQLEAYPVTPWRVNVDVIWSNRRKAGAAAWWLREHLRLHKYLSEHIS